MPTTIPVQPDTTQTAVTPQERGGDSLEKIRPDLNLEKWSIWQPAKSHNKKTRTLRREIIHDNGDVVTSAVTIGYIDSIGTITTEDQKTCYALIKIWEDKGRSSDHTSFSLRRLSRVKNKGWGANVIESESRSLTRLRAVPLILNNAYFDSTTKETIEVLDTFNILSELKIIKRKIDGHVAKEIGYFKFNDFILKNLLNNYTKPVLLEVVLGFQSELAQILYTHLDLIMARRNHYERRTKELFDDLGLHGEVEYQYPSGRKRKLEKALKELKGARLTTGIITTATLERTKDDKDWKLIIHKSSRMPLALPNHTQADPESGGVVALPTQPPITNDPLTTEAKELIAHFYKLFHNTETSYPTSKAINQAIALIAYHGLDPARHIVDFSHQAAQETNYKPQTFGGIIQYTTQAIADYDQAQRRKAAEAQTREAQRRTEEEEQLRWQYEGYYKEHLTKLKATTPPDTLTAIEQAAATHFDQANTNPFGRDMMRRIAIDNAIAAHFQLPSFEEWRATQRTHHTQPTPETTNANHPAVHNGHQPA